MTSDTSGRRRGASEPFDDGLGWRLRRHFATEEADAHFRSLHGALVEMALVSPGGASRAAADAHMDDRDLERTKEHRRVRRALASLRKPQQRALWLAYGPHAWPSEVEVRFAELGQCCGVVLLSQTAQRAFDAEMNKKRATLRAEKRATAAELGGKLDEWINAHCQATADVRAQLGRVTGRMRWTKDPALREALEREAIALAERLRTMRAGGPRILPVLDAPPEAVEEQSRVERAERLGVGEWLRGKSAMKHAAAIVDEARSLLCAARRAIAEALDAQHGKAPRMRRRTRDVREEFWQEATRGEVRLV